MIATLRGTLLDRSLKGDAVIEVAGVGYRVNFAASGLARLGEIGSDVFIWVHTHVREDAFLLYGFSTREERTTFEILLGAHGVGPALALAIVNALSPSALALAVAGDDVDALTVVPGVGKKTAQRLVLELKSRFDLADLDTTVVVPRAASGVGDQRADDPRADVRAALSELGYGADEVRNVIRRLPTTGDSRTLLRQALALIADGAGA